jgi:GTP cyclohydrolase IB
MMENNSCSELPDIQCSEPQFKIPIKQVGVQNIEVPFVLESKYGGFHSMFANVSMRTNLDQNIKGISMSRLLLTLKPYLDLPLKHKLIRKILEELQQNIGSTDSYIKFDFRFPMKKKSPKTDFSFPLFYKCSFEGQLHGKDNFKFFQGVIIQYASYCPCSAELCKDLEGKESKGFPHNQRSFANVTVETVDPHYVWLEDIIETVEGSIRTLPYPIIKREDEQEIARIAAENPMFVEDAIRAISFSLNMDGRIYDWIVRCVHEESIHTSEAIAINFKGVENGFTERFFM